jgi:hypothetical protein
MSTGNAALYSESMLAMNLDASRKAQLIVFMCMLLRLRMPAFPAGYVAFMTINGITGTYIYAGNNWRYVG